MQKTHFEPLLTTDDIMKIFGVSRPTVYRWDKLAHEGRSRFPCSIGDAKQRLRWSREAILAYQNASNSQPTPKIESAGERSRRHVAAMKSLADKGVTLSQK